MIQVDVIKEKYDQDIKTKSIKVTGHSGYADKGFDIVCSAVSALIITVCNSITELVKAEGFSADVKSGEALLSLEGSACQEKREKAELLLDTLILGLESIKESYPKTIEIRYNFKDIELGD